jgi:hypothetical protein
MAAALRPSTSQPRKCSKSIVASSTSNGSLCALSFARCSDKSNSDRCSIKPIPIPMETLSHNSASDGRGYCGSIWEWSALCGYGRARSLQIAQRPAITGTQILWWFATAPRRRPDYGQCPAYDGGQHSDRYRHSDPRWFGIKASGIDVQVPRARFRHRLRFTDRLSSWRYGFLNRRVCRQQCSGKSG